MRDEPLTIEIDGETIEVTSPSKVMFPARGWTKRDVVEHFRACVDGALRGVFGRPTMLKRWPKGAAAQPFFQKRAPAGDRETITVKFPSGRSAAYFVPRSPADIIWMAHLNCLDLNPWPSRAEHPENPDELRIDLDPTPEAEWQMVQEVAMCVHDVLVEAGLVGWPKTSGSKGIHIYVRIEPEFGFSECRRATLAVAREVERRLPELATSEWWKENRHGVFIDFNQMSRDRTVASAYSIRPTGFVSAPLTWDEVPHAAIEDFALDTFTERYLRHGDIHEGIDEAVCSLTTLLDLADDDAGIEPADDDRWRQRTTRRWGQWPGSPTGSG